MKTIHAALAAATVLAAVGAASAETRIYDPSAGTGDPRFISIPDRTHNTPASGDGRVVDSGSAVSTNDSGFRAPVAKPWFGPNPDFATNRNGPYDN